MDNANSKEPSLSLGNTEKPKGRLEILQTPLQLEKQEGGEAYGEYNCTALQLRGAVSNIFHEFILSRHDIPRSLSS